MKRINFEQHSKVYEDMKYSLGANLHDDLRWDLGPGHTPSIYTEVVTEVLVLVERGCDDEFTQP